MHHMLFMVSPSAPLRTGLSNQERPFDRLRVNGRIPAFGDKAIRFRLDYHPRGAHFESGLTEYERMRAVDSYAIIDIDRRNCAICCPWNQAYNRPISRGFILRAT